MHLPEHVVIGSANHAYAWVVFAKEHCTGIVLRVFNPMPQRSSREGGHSCGSLEIIARMWQPLALKMLSQENRVPVKVAVAAAIAYVKELYEGISLRDLLLEEIEYSDASDKWLVTLGFSLPETKEVSTSVILPSRTSRELSRRYKTVIIDAVSGAPDSMKIRTI